MDQNKELKYVLDALEDMWCQFAYSTPHGYPKTSRFDGGLSALEDAYEILIKHKRILENGLTIHENTKTLAGSDPTP